MRTGELADLARSEIKRCGGVINRERESRHIVIYWSIDSAKFMTVVPRRGNAPRLIANATADIRRRARAS